MTAAIIPLQMLPSQDGEREYKAAIQLWCHASKTADRLTLQEIGAMSELDRLDVQRKAIIISLARFYQEHPRSDVAPGVAVLIALLSNNERSSAQISQATMAKLFGRSMSSISDAYKRLKSSDIIEVGRGRYATACPVVPRCVTSEHGQLRWLVDALCGEPLASEADNFAPVLPLRDTPYRKSSITPALRLAVLRRDGFCCVQCGASGVELHADHVVSEARGGATVFENLQTLCRSCNIKKGAV